MFAAIYNEVCAALAARRAAVLEAEAIVGNGDYAALRYAMDLAADPYRSYDERLHYERVVVVALRRRRLLQGLDTGTKYDVINKWRYRRGSQVR